MHKKLFLVLIAVLLVVAAGCSTATGADTDSPPDITGLIYSVDGNTILVVDGIEDVNIPFDEWFDHGYRAVWFTAMGDTVIEIDGEEVSFDALAKGQKVQVWAEGGLRESYPEQGTAKKILVIE